MTRRALTAALAALASVATAEAFSLAPHVAGPRAPGLLRRTPAAVRGARPPRAYIGRLRAQLRPDDEQGAKAESDARATWQDFLRSAQEGWTSAAADRSASASSLPNVFLVPVWLGVVGAGNLCVHQHYI
jgi:hypothetical protein